MQNFVHLHVHTQYSLLDGQSSISRLVDKALKDGMPGIAVTDHGNMFGIKEFWNYVAKKNGAKHANIKSLTKLKKQMVELLAAHPDLAAYKGELAEQIADELGYNLDQCGYPHKEEEILAPLDLMQRYQEERASLNAEIDRVLADLAALLGGAVE